jgi:AcrR family transcriptional regulator
MSRPRSRRELYSEATRTALQETAARMFAEGGYTATSLDDIAEATQVTRGAVYHHFASKQALFEAVFEACEVAMLARVVTAAAEHSDSWEAAMAAIDAFLDAACDPAYGRLCWQEAPLALGWQRWLQIEEKHALGLVEQFVRLMLGAEALTPIAIDATTRLAFHLVGGACRVIADAPPEAKGEVRDTCAVMLKRMVAGIRVSGPDPA